MCVSAGLYRPMQVKSQIPLQLPRGCRQRTRLQGSFDCADRFAQEDRVVLVG
jgi:hypothetical protein